MTSFIQAGMPALRTPSLVQLDERARDIFRMVVETYLETGEPVGSRTVSKGGVHLSPASIRNTMQDLAGLGLLEQRVVRDLAEVPALAVEVDLRAVDAVGAGGEDEVAGVADKAAVDDRQGPGASAG